MDLKNNPPPVNDSWITNMRVEVPNGRSKSVLAVASFNYCGVILTKVELRQGKKSKFLKYPGGSDAIYFPCNEAVHAIHMKAVLSAYEQQISGHSA